MDICRHRRKVVRRTPRANVYACAVHGVCSAVRVVGVEEGVRLPTCHGCNSFEAGGPTVTTATPTQKGKTKTTSLPCVHLGEPTGETRPST